MIYLPSKRRLAVAGLLLATALAPVAAFAVTQGTDAAAVTPATQTTTPAAAPDAATPNTSPATTPGATASHATMPEADAERPPMPPRGMFGRFPMGPPPWFGRGFHGEGPDGDRRGPGRGDPAMRLAGRLAALEELVGIHVSQLDAWRDYTSALIDFLSPPPRPASPAAGDDKTPMIFGERMADGALGRADKARKLKDAIEALRKVLTTDQLQRLAEAERRDRPERFAGPGRPGRDGWHGPMGGPGMPGMPDMPRMPGGMYGMHPMPPLPDDGSQDDHPMPEAGHGNFDHPMDAEPDGSEAN